MVICDLIGREAFFFIVLILVFSAPSQEVRPALNRCCYTDQIISTF